MCEAAFVKQRLPADTQPHSLSSCLALMTRPVPADQRNQIMTGITLRHSTAAGAEQGRNLILLLCSGNTAGSSHLRSLSISTARSLPVCALDRAVFQQGPCSLGLRRVSRRAQPELIIVKGSRFLCVSHRSAEMLGGVG